MRKILSLILACILLAGQLSAQNRTVTGKVTDDNGAPVPNASVIIKGTNTGTTSNDDGSFSLPVPPRSRALVVSIVGYVTKDVSISNNDNILVSLSQSKNSLDEIVVVAYGTQKKSNVTGAVNTIKATDIENQPFTSVDRALQGAVPGLQSVSASGAPGALQQIRLRGIGSITASSEPLWVIDGIPVNTGDVSRLATSSNLLSSLNPNDIESISVLKDAAASSIYGARAANGVILVTTKKGKAGKTKFRFDAEMGQSDIAYYNEKYRPLDASEYFALTREGLINAGTATPATVDALMTSNFGFGNGVNTDWLKEVTRTGNQAQYNVSASGGTDKTTFFISGGYFNQEGSVIQSDFKRYNSNIRLTNKATDKLSLNANFNGGYTHVIAPLAGGSFGNPVLSAYFLLPSRSPYKADGSLNITAPDFGPGALHNTVATSTLDKRLLKLLSIRGNVGGEYAIVKNVSIASTFGIDYNTIEEDQYNNPFHGDGANTNGRAYAYYTRFFNWVWSNTASYKQSLLNSGDLNFDLKVGYEAQLSKNYNISAQSQGFPPNTALTLPGAGASPITASATATDYSFASAFSLANVNYQDKYVVSGSFRRDGSSRFGLNRRFGNFWSVGATWNVDKENFMENVDFFDQVKLRASYGVNGNAGIGNYDALAVYGYSTNVNYNQLPGSGFTNPGNPDLTWELNKPFNIGVDLGILKNRISLTVDYYSRETTQLLLQAQTSRTVGFSNFTANIGGMQNKGIELGINATPVKTMDFSWDVSFNFAHNQNKITSLYNNADNISGSFIRRVGYDFQTFYVRQWSGVDPANGDPLWYLDSTKGGTTNNYNAAQRVLFGSASPKYFGSLTNTFSFKGFTLETQFYYNFGNYVRDIWGGFYASSGSNGGFNKVQRQYDERWQKSGDVATYPKYIYNGNKLAQSFSTLYMFKGDYIRLRNIQLGYVLPQTLLPKLRLGSAFFYVRGTNVWTWVKDKNAAFDPEQGVASEANLQVFIPKTLTVGLNLGF